MSEPVRLVRLNGNSEYADDDPHRAEVEGRTSQPGDACTRSGAQRIATALRAYWTERNRDVTVTIYEAAFNPVMRTARYDVRSDMVDGLPVRRV